MSCLIVGASSGLGRSLAYTLARNNFDLILVSSDISDLKPISKHLSYLYKVKIECIAANAANSDLFAKALFSKIINYKDIEYVFFPMGVSFDGDNIEISNHRLRELMNINFESIIMTCNFILTNQTFSKLKTIVGFGSIATARARKNNVIYTAAKAALQFYFQSIKHAFADKINIQFYIPGYLLSQQSIYKNLVFKPASTDKFSELILKNINKNFEFKFFPFYWSFISFLLKKIPWVLFKRLNF